MLLRLRAAWLDPTDTARPLIAIALSCAEPDALRAWRAVKRLGLPPRAAETCLYLLLGLTQREIADRMNLSLNAVIYHRRRIYDQLGVNDRGELAGYCFEV
ncbi:LuxR C-terminal-related transcriptional regulator [Edaphosphingomonas haloaromaticamans]|uniref:HTH luxR-type domain-containing protein n=1 Tax=Edaphosphingomonas haloaromaticamans TaxID=653954 RepID=A0A1S1HDJ8_9SPHN|nr:helix-turn-helix transcriptional regulator [Sphingomonas haloaromaticamans]OHT18560.1 hypothetical protein BHE75_00534 [Sphingomonas haloaromaticamans]